MNEFISENVWTFIIIGIVIFFIAIGYIVDKFVLNKETIRQKTKKGKNVNKIVNQDADVSNDTFNKV